MLSGGSTAVLTRLQTVVFGLAIVAIALIVGTIVGFIVVAGDIRDLRKRTTNVGNLLGECAAGQVLGFNGSGIVCMGDVVVLDDLDDVTAPEPDDEQCLCFFNITWGPQGPFVKVGDIPPLGENDTLPCENLPDDLCNALRWGTPVGSWDANANVPILSGGGCPFGDFYVVTAAGNTNLDGNFEWDVGDALACSATGWKRIGKNFPVLSVNGMTGNVTLGLDDLTDVDLTGQMDVDFMGLVGGVWGPQQPMLTLDNLTDVDAAGAADGNTIVFDGVEWALDSTCCDSGDTAQRDGARAQVAFLQLIPNGIGLNTIVLNNVELDDPGGNYIPGGGNPRYIAPVTGFYGAWAYALFNELLMVGFAQWEIRVRIVRNGSPIATSKEHRGSTNGLVNLPAQSTTGVTTVGFFRMNAGDVLQMDVAQVNVPGFAVNIEGFIFSATALNVVFHGPV